MKETIFSTGQPQPLHGVLTEPAVSEPRGALVILNSGLLHHVGSCLLSVRLARQAAERGWLVLRADASGIGDSPARQTGLDHEQQSVADTLELVAALRERHAIDNVVLFGLCSGAFAAFEAALKDETITGIAAIAPFAFRTPRWHMNQLRQRFLSPEALTRILHRLTGHQRSNKPHYEAEFLEPNSDIGWNQPAKATLEAGYRQLVERGARFLNMFTAGELVSYNYEGQFREMFPTLAFGDQLEELFIPEALHIIPEPSYQAVVLERTLNWLDAHPAPVQRETEAP